LLNGRVGFNEFEQLVVMGVVRHEIREAGRVCSRIEREFSRLIWCWQVSASTAFELAVMSLYFGDIMKWCFYDSLTGEIQ
jgi:hypothetical protein